MRWKKVEADAFFFKFILPHTFCKHFPRCLRVAYVENGGRPAHTNKKYIHIHRNTHI